MQALVAQCYSSWRTQIQWPCWGRWIQFIVLGRNFDRVQNAQHNDEHWNQSFKLEIPEFQGESLLQKVIWLDYYRDEEILEFKHISLCKSLVISLLILTIKCKLIYNLCGLPNLFWLCLLASQFKPNIFIAMSSISLDIDF